MRTQVLTFLSVLILIVMGVASFNGPASAADPDYLATIAAQTDEIVSLEATVKARGRKINAQRTQIANLKSTIEAMPQMTPTPDVEDPYITQLLIDATALVESCDIFDAQMHIAGNGGTADFATVFGALQNFHDTFNAYVNVTPPAQYADIHEDFVAVVSILDSASYTFESYLYGSGDDSAMELAMYDYLIASKDMRENILPQIEGLN